MAFALGISGLTAFSFNGGGNAASATNAPAVPLELLPPTVAPVPKPSLRTEIIAHRGDVAVGTENTPAALSAAFRNGADAVEFDVVWTKDNVPVVMHDVDLAKHTLNCTGRTYQKTYAEFRACKTKDGAPAPNLDEALAAVEASGKKVYVHVKTRAGLGIGAKIVAAVERHGLDNGRAVFFGHQPAMLNELQKAGAGVVGLIFFDDMADWAWTSNYSILIPFDTEVRPEYVRAAQSRGQLVIPVESKPLTLGEARAIGVDGMIANHLSRALATFSAK